MAVVVRSAVVQTKTEPPTFHTRSECSTPPRRPDP